MDLSIKKPSAWQYTTSCDIGGGKSGAAGIKKLTLGMTFDAGYFDLVDPFKARKLFYFGSVGLGLGGAVPLDKLGLQNSELGKNLASQIEKYCRDAESQAIGPSFAPSAGKIYLLNQCSKQELDVDDLQGACLWINVSLGAGIGASFSVMFFGMSMIMLEAADLGAPMAFSPLIAAEMLIVAKMLSTATGVMLFGGVNVSNTVVAANLAGYVGAIA